MKNEEVGVLDSYQLGGALKPSARKLGERCGPAAVTMLANRLVQSIDTAEDDRYSYIWRSAIEEHEQDAHKDSYRTVLVDAVRDAALGATGTPSEEANSAAKALLESSYPILARVGIYVCGENYASVGRVFWDCVKPNWLLDVAYWHELFWFIKKGFAKFSASERSRFIAMVDQVQGDWSDESRQEEWDEKHRRDLLHSVVGLGDAEIDAKYTALTERWGAVREHPDFHSYTTADWVGDRSPVTSDALVGMSDDTLIALLREFKPEPKAWDGPTYRGLASALSAAVRASNDGFANRIKLFANMDWPYQHGLLRGLKERWSDDKRDINWLETLSVVHSVVTAPAFKADLNADPGQSWEPSVHWVVTDISDLLKAGSSGERQLTPDLYTKCLEILQLILAATAPTMASDSKDAVSHAINSPRGRALEALVNVALALRRIEAEVDEDTGHMWALVAPILEAELTSSESGQNAEFSTLAGMYCTNLHYLNPQWVETNFDRLFSTSNDPAWKCAAQGFSYQRYLYGWLYEKLSGGEHLKRMVFSAEIPEQVSERALQFLGLAYLEGQEELSGDGLLAELVVTLRTKELAQLCWFFWTLRGSEKEVPSRAPRILQFWKQVFEAIRESGQAWPELHSALSLLAVFIDDLTPSLVQIWEEAAPHAQFRHHGYILIEHLARLAGKYPTEIAIIFRATISGFLPDYRQEDVVRCVSQLAESGQVEEAEWICNTYAERGSTLLKDTYETLRASQRARLAPGATPS